MKSPICGESVTNSKYQKSVHIRSALRSAGNALRQKIVGLDSVFVKAKTSKTKSPKTKAKTNIIPASSGPLCFDRLRNLAEQGGRNEG